MVLKLDEEKLTKEVEDITPQLPTERGGGVRTISRLNFFRLGILIGGFHHQRTIPLTLREII